MGMVTAMSALLVVLVMPTDLAATTNGGIGIFSKIINIGAPMLAEVPQPLPNIVLTFLNGGALMAAQTLRCSLRKKE